MLTRNYILFLVLILCFAAGCKKDYAVGYPVTGPNVVRFTRPDSALLGYVHYRSYNHMYNSSPYADFLSYDLEIEVPPQKIYIRMYDFRYNSGYDEVLGWDVGFYLPNIHLKEVDGSIYLYDSSATIIGRFDSIDPYSNRLEIHLENYPYQGEVYNKRDTLYSYQRF